MGRRLLVLVGAFLALALVAAACGNDDDESTATDATAEATEEPSAEADGDGAATEEPTEEATAEPTEEATEEPTAEPTEEATEEPTGAEGAAGEPVAGGEVVYAITGEISGFDPTINQGGACCGGSQAFAVFGALVFRDPDTGLTEPLMAESFESDDAQNWTIVLHEGMTFTDGTPFDAEAVIFNIERQRDTEGAVGQAPASLITEMTAVDDVTVEMTLEAPFAALPFFFMRQLASFGSPTAIEELGDDFNAQPVGAGPFVLEEWSPDEQTVLVRNDDYFDPERPYLDQITFVPIPDDDQRLQTLLTGGADIALARTAEQIVEIENTDGFAAYVQFGPANQSNLFNVTQPPFDDVRVRQAWAQALDIDTLNDVVFDGVEIMSRAFSYEDNPWYNPDIEYLEYDPDAAAALIEEYEAENGEIGTITYTTGQQPEFVQPAEFIQASMAEIGLDVELEVLELAAFVGKVFEGDFQVSQWGIATHDDPSTEVYDVFYSTSARNRPGIENAELDGYLETMRTSTDFDERYDAWTQAQQLLAEEVPLLPIRVVQQAQLYNTDRVADVVGSAATIWLSDRTYRVDQ